MGELGLTWAWDKEDSEDGEVSSDSSDQTLVPPVNSRTAWLKDIGEILEGFLNGEQQHQDEHVEAWHCLDLGTDWS